MKDKIKRISTGALIYIIISVLFKLISEVTDWFYFSRISFAAGFLASIIIDIFLYEDR